MLRWFERSQVYQPYRALREDGGALGRPWEDVRFPAADGVDLHAWYFPAAPDSPRRRFVISYAHGNGGNISHRLEAYGALLETGVGVFGFDYRGYGRSRGSPSESGTYLDAQGAHAWLRQKGYASTNILAYGESLGGAVAAELALREPLGGIILQSTFTSIPDVGAEIFPFLPVRRIASIRYDTRSKLPRIHVPVLVMHSKPDTIIPYHHGQDLFGAANAPRLFWELEGDHNDVVDADRARFIAGMEKFLNLIELQRK
jgi:fermentation-respiration switch protein FrsA (DUF1100 family)